MSQTSSQQRGWLESRACYLACALSMFANGTMNAFPVFSTKLLAAGLDTSQIVITGVIIQMGYGLSSILFAAFYARTYTRLSLAGVDRAANIFACSLVLGSLALLIGLLANAEAVGEPVNGAALSFLFLVWGSGLGLSAFHSLSLVNFIFVANKAQRRMAIASMTFSLGIGSVVYTLLYQFVLNSISLINNMVVLLVSYVLITGFRLVYMQRGRFEAVPVLSELPALVPADEEGRGSAESTTTLELGDLGSNSAESHHQGAHGDDLLHSTASPPASDQIVAEAAPTVWSYLQSRIVWLLSVSTFFGFGVGATFLSSVGSLAASLEESEAEIDALTFSLTLSLLCMMLVARLATTIVYAHLNWPYVLAVWNVALFVGILVFTASPTMAGAYASACLVGLGFGGISSVPAVVATSNFPGSAQYYSVNVAVTAILMSLGPFIIGYMQTVIEEKSRIRLGSGFENLNTFIYFLVGSFFSTVCAVMLGYEIRKDYLLEMSVLRADPTHDNEVLEMQTRSNPRSLEIAQI
ncbi:Hypothetical Protein FCC1311_071912 [Hondaea fermentalgiana]|uniref:Uncharacterized protein n=1 Tax=Hondaea fermentalgiana TaxID=2315210 RepID=A0A2R5GJA8_9STRA|nr:Hypothetical Protein FCC1311_071912 [Hondaea fermentalgiana]|eukprot:GBG30970.1 Hypothetical Protein FCC1311_071912 [Hondaea fermentalgiana]